MGDINKSSYEAILEDLKSGSIFTCDTPLKEYLGDLSRRYHMLYGETLNTEDYEITVKQLVDKGFIYSHK